MINQYPEVEAIYSDEDKITMDAKQYFGPHFKPDFNLDLLRSENYICHLFVVKRNLFEQVGFLRHEFDGAQDFDFVLRCAEKAINSIIFQRFYIIGERIRIQQQEDRKVSFTHMKQEQRLFRHIVTDWDLIQKL